MPDHRALQPNRHLVARLALASLFTLLGCSRDDGKAERAEAALASDSALERDLALAGDLTDPRDSAAYLDAANVAMEPQPEPLTDPSVPAPASPPTVTTRSGSAAPSGVRPEPSASRREVARPAAPVTSSPAPGTARSDAAPPAPTAVARPAPAATAVEACRSPAAGDQRRCLFAYLARSDAGLDRTYQALIRQLKERAGTAAGAPEPESVERLRVAQRAWLVYRDTECRRRNHGHESTLWAPVRAQCLGEFSAAREQELASQLR